MYKEFRSDVIKFNKMYGLPVNEEPVNLGRDRLINFRGILLEELSEIKDVMDSLNKNNVTSAMVDIADLLGDLIVYCSTECSRWGLLPPVSDSYIGSLGEFDESCLTLDFLYRFQDDILECLSTYDNTLDLLDRGRPAMASVLLFNMLSHICHECEVASAALNIPLDKVLKVIMHSNFSKLGEDGKPIINEQGKVIKGPNFVPPDDKIREVLCLQKNTK